MRELEQEAAKTLARVEHDPASALDDFELSEADRAVLQDQVLQQVLLETLQESVVSGVWGWVDDDLAFIKAWGFELEEIRVPVQVRYGIGDVLVPAAHGAWLAGHVPNASVIVDGDSGHLSTPDESLARLRTFVAG